MYRLQRLNENGYLQLPPSHLLKRQLTSSEEERLKWLFQELRAIQAILWKRFGKYWFIRSPLPSWLLLRSYIRYSAVAQVSVCLNSEVPSVASTGRVYPSIRGVDDKNER